MANGTIKFFNAAKGFGFITSDESSKDIFLPAASITAAGVPGLKAGQQVSFTIQPDTKGPKAVDLKIVGPAPAPRPPKQDLPAKSTNTLTLYLDPASPAANEVLAELRRAGQAPTLVDYIASPLSKEILRNLSLMLRDADQSMVRKYDPLYRELRLDDRFISDSEYWEAIFEHPSLINGPILATASKARLCHSKADVKSFSVATDSNGGALTKRKGLSPDLLRLISGGAAPAAGKAPIESPQPKAPAPLPKKVRAAPVKKPSAKLKSVKAKPAPKSTGRKPVKKAAAKSKKR